MRRAMQAVLMVALMGMSTPALGLTPVALSAQRFGDATQQICQSAASDAAGNVILTGYFVGTLNFGGGDLVSPISYDIFLVKFNAAGVHQWSQSFGVSGHQYAYSVATDPDGNIYVAGYFEGTVNFGGADLVSAGSADIYFATFNPAGVHQWSQRFGDADGQYCYAAATDATGNVYLPCILQGTADFGGGNLASAGSADIVLARFDGTGAHQWSQRFGDASAQYAYSAATDPAGNVYLGGWFAGTVNFGGVALASVGGFDVCLAKFDAAGVHQWSKRFGSPDSQYLQSVATDASSNVYITGRYLGGINFGLGPNPSAGGEDIYLAKFDAAGVPQWARRFGDASLEQSGYALSTDAAGNVYLAGHAQGTVDFGGGNLTSAGDHDAYLAKFSAAGVHQWSQHYGGATDQRAYAVAVDNDGNAWLAGYFTGDVDFGTGTLTSAGIEDVFLAKFSALTAEPVISSITDIGNDQGRSVLVEFSASYHDNDAVSNRVVWYEAYLRNDAPPAAALSAASGPAPLAEGWTFVGSVSAHSEGAYALIAPTIGDSTATLGQYHSVYFIRAATPLTDVFFDSPPDSGYSLDNVPPGAPAGLRVETGRLAWGECEDEDFDFFTVYGGPGENFGAASAMNRTTATRYDIAGSEHTCFFVTATDFAGNEGEPALINLAGTTTPPSSLSISGFPNPFNPRTTVRFTVPSRGAVDVVVYDARGAPVVTLLRDDVREAGVHAVDWNGRDARGVLVSTGVYFARIEHNGTVRTTKLTLLK